MEKFSCQRSKSITDLVESIDSFTFSKICFFKWHLILIFYICVLLCKTTELLMPSKDNKTISIVPTAWPNETELFLKTLRSKYPFLSPTTLFKISTLFCFSLKDFLSVFSNLVSQYYSTSVIFPHIKISSLQLTCVDLFFLTKNQYTNLV